MSDLVLDREHVWQMLSRPDFYEKCPEFRKLRDCARHMGDARVRRSLFDAFFFIFTELDAVATKRLKEYLAAKKGYRPGHLVMYYNPRQPTRLSKG